MCCTGRDEKEASRPRSLSGISSDFADATLATSASASASGRRLPRCSPGSPRLILLDEPTRGMDAPAKELLVRNLARRREDGACVVLASHDVELVARFAGRVVLLAEGEVDRGRPARCGA